MNAFEDVKAAIMDSMGYDADSHSKTDRQFPISISLVSRVPAARLLTEAAAVLKLAVVPA